MPNIIKFKKEVFSNKLNISIFNTQTSEEFCLLISLSPSLYLLKYNDKPLYFKLYIACQEKALDKIRSGPEFLFIKWEGNLKGASRSMDALNG